MEDESLRVLLKKDFQLAFLACLTSQGLKPMSRWEKPLARSEEKTLEELGLAVGRARRSALSGKEVAETLFSRHHALVELYRERFDGRPLDRGSAVQRIEGLLFGFPGCCVESFLRQPYRPNGLDPAEQRILFHWSCPDCEPTRLLLPRYRLIHRQLEEIGCTPPSYSS